MLEVFKEFIEGYPQITVIDYRRLLECGFGNEEDNICYGFQLHFLEFSQESLRFVQEEIPDLISALDLEGSEALSVDSPAISSYEKTVLSSLKKEHSEVCILSERQAHVEEALKRYLHSISKFRQAIEARDVSSVQEFLAQYPNVDLEDLELPGEYFKGSEYHHSHSFVYPLPLAICAESVKIIMALLKSKRIKSYQQYVHQIASAIIKQDDLEAFLYFIELEPVRGMAKSLLVSGNLTTWFAKQSRVTGKIAGWFIQHYKAQLDINSIISAALAELSFQVVEYWLNQNQHFPAVNINIYSLWYVLTNKKGNLTSEEQAGFLKLLDKVLRADESVHANTIVPYLGTQFSFSRQVLLCIATRLNPDKRKAFMDSVVHFINDQSFLELSSEHLTPMLEIFKEFLTTIEMGNSYWIWTAVEKRNVKLFSALLQIDNYDETFSLSSSLRKLVEGGKEEDLEVLEEMLSVVIRIASSNAEHRLVQIFMKEFQEKRHLDYYFNKKFVESFDKAAKKEALLQEKALKAREEASALSGGGQMFCC